MIKILVVDDEKGLCDYLKEFLVSRGFYVLTATNGVDALVLVKEAQPKIILLDVHMPGMSGLEVLQEVKKSDSSIRVIMITVMDDERTISEAKRLGVNQFIAKPFVTDALEEVIAQEVKELLQAKGL